MDLFELYMRVKFDNCLHFVEMVANKHFNKTTTLFYDNNKNIIVRHGELATLEKDGFDISKAKDGDFVTMREIHRKIAAHIGIYYGGKILHYYNGHLYYQHDGKLANMGLVINKFYEGFSYA